jgi:CBS domain-containing protein
MALVRDAMVPEPRTLPATARADEAGQVFLRPEVRAIFVCEEGRLLGVVTRGTLVREVVAAGRDATAVAVGEIAEEPRHTLASELPLDDAFHFLEEHDLERVPVTENGMLVGVLSRAVVQRRLAEDEPPETDG